MASYIWLTAVPELQVLSEDYSRDAQRVTAQAVPSEIVFSALFAPYPYGPNGEVVWTDALIAQELELEASRWNENALVPHVLGISMTQQPDVTGRLRDIAMVIVSSTSGKTTLQVPFTPVQWLPRPPAGYTSFSEHVAGWVARLDALEAG